MKFILDKLQKKLSKSKYFKKIDLNYYFTGGAWLGTSQFLTSLKGFALSILFANLVSKELFGQYSFILSVINIMLLFAVPGMKRSVINSVSKGEDGTYMAAIKSTAKWSILGSIGILCAAVYSYIQQSPNGSLIFLLMSILFPLYAVSSFFKSFFVGRKDFKTLFKLTITFEFVQLVTLVLAILYMQHLVVLVLANILINTLMCGYYSVVYCKKFLKNNKVNKDDLEFGKKSTFAHIINNFAFRFDSIVLFYFLGFEEIAIFTIITMLPDQLKKLKSIVNPLLHPRLNQIKEQSKKPIKQAYFILMVFSVVAILGYAIASPLLFKWFYPLYSDYVKLSIIYSIGFISFPAQAILLYLIKEKKAHDYNSINVTGSTYLVIGSVTLIYFFGLFGAVLNRVIFRLLMLTIYSTKLFKKE